MRFALAAAIVLFAAPAFAGSQADPVKLLTELYAQYTSSATFPDQDAIDAMQSDRLNALFEQDSKEANGEIGRIEFDPYVNGQDYEIKQLVIEAPYFAGGKAIVHVTFENFGTPQNLGYALVNENGGWKIDDVWAASDDYSYDLLDILQSPMP